jgi:hypothetical protein
MSYPNSAIYTRLLFCSQWFFFFSGPHFENPAAWCPENHASHAVPYPVNRDGSLGSFGPEGGKFEGTVCTEEIAQAIEENWSNLEKACGDNPFVISLQDPKSIEKPQDILCLYIVQGGHRRWITSYIHDVLLNGSDKSDPFFAKIRRRWQARHPDPFMWVKVYTRGMFQHSFHSRIYLIFVSLPFANDSFCEGNQSQR